MQQKIKKEKKKMDDDKEGGVGGGYGERGWVFGGWNSQHNPIRGPTGWL